MTWTGWIETFGHYQQAAAAQDIGLDGPAKSAATARVAMAWRILLMSARQTPTYGVTIVTDQTQDARSMPKKHTYALYQGREKVYIGRTDNLDRRLEEHRDDGKRFTRAEKTSRLMSEDGAQDREADQLETYRDGHGGKNPQYNKTDKG